MRDALFCSLDLYYLYSVIPFKGFIAMSLLVVKGSLVRECFFIAKQYLGVSIPRAIMYSSTTAAEALFKTKLSPLLSTV